VQAGEPAAAQDPRSSAAPAYLPVSQPDRRWRGRGFGQVPARGEPRRMSISEPASLVLGIGATGRVRCGPAGPHPPMAAGTQRGSCAGGRLSGNGSTGLGCHRVAHGADQDPRADLDVVSQADQEPGHIDHLFDPQVAVTVGASRPASRCMESNRRRRLAEDPRQLTDSLSILCSPSAAAFYSGQ
jgi:hypothetical protein